MAASVVHLARVATDRATPRAEWDNPQAIRHFSVVQHLQGQPFPPGAPPGARLCQLTPDA